MNQKYMHDQKMVFKYYSKAVAAYSAEKIFKKTGQWKMVLPITQSKIPLAKWETFLSYACISLHQNSTTGMERKMSNKRKMISKESIMDILMVVLMMTAILLLALVLWSQVFPG